MNKTIDQLNIKIFSDGADKNNILALQDKPYIKGWTTNPTLMRQEGVVNYEAFAKEILSLVRTKPISFEVLSDDHDEMEQQALTIASWADNVYVKIPITNTRKENCMPLVKKLVRQNIKLNITAVMTLEQVTEMASVLSDKVPSFISIFAGRIADTGKDPLPMIKAALDIVRINPLIELIWASPRELLNIFQADAIGCHVITVTKDILKKIPLVGYCLKEYSLDTVKMFYNDAMAAGFTL